MKVLWAFDPFRQDKVRTRRMYHLIKAVSGSDIEIGYVANRMDPDLNLAFDIPHEKRFNSYPWELIKKSLKSAKVPIADQLIHVIDFESFSTTKSVDCFLRLAQERSADLVTLFTHSRQGLPRFFLGSFAETAVHRSKVNLLMVNPKSNLPKRIRRVLFLSDFTDSSTKQLKQVLRMCRNLDAELTIFHAAQFIYKVSLHEKSPEALSYRRRVDRLKTRFEKLCQTSGVACQIIINSEFKMVADSALECARKKKSDLIVVAAQTGSLSALIGGSITRQVLRSSTKPVLVLK